MSFRRKLDDHVVGQSLAACLLSYVLFTGFAKSQTVTPAAVSNKNEIAEATDQAKQDDSGSIYFVEKLAHLGAVQAIPMLEAKFTRTQDVVDKAHIASVLVRLGDRDDSYWAYLMKVATAAVESQAPEFMNYDAQGKALAGPSPEFVAWAKANNVSPAEAGEQAEYLLPGEVGLLGLTKDARAVPLLRQGLSSRNHELGVMAALGLAEIHDKDSIPLIIEACAKAPAEVASAMAGALVYFDDPRARSAVDKYMSKRQAEASREAKAKGKQVPF